MAKSKTTPWNKIKAEYLQGAAPKELAAKYGLTAKQVSNKANIGKWATENKQIKENVSKNVQDRIKDLTHIALDTLIEVINDPDCKNTEKIAAAKAILDVSGLKNSKQEITGVNGELLTIKKVFITAEEQKDVDKHIDSVING